MESSKSMLDTNDDATGPAPCIPANEDGALCPVERPVVEGQPSTADSATSGPDPAPGPYVGWWRATREEAWSPIGTFATPQEAFAGLDALKPVIGHRRVTLESYGDPGTVLERSL